MSAKLIQLNDKISACRTCARLVRWREQVAQEKRAAYANEIYWGRPITGFGDTKAKIFIVGLAPGAHGANRTGRVFTGDRSGEWLYRALFKAGLSNQATSESRSDDLQLQGAYISLVVRCVPPENKPTPAERDTCLPYLTEELEHLKKLKVIIPLGGFALEGILQTLRTMGQPISPKPKFKHLLEFSAGSYVVLCSLHPSQQNTFTGKLTEKMFDHVFARALQILAD